MLYIDIYIKIINDVYNNIIKCILTINNINLILYLKLLKYIFI